MQKDSSYTRKIRMNHFFLTVVVIWSEDELISKSSNELRILTDDN